MAGWHHQLDGHEFELTLGVGDGQGGLACPDSWGRRELDMTERLNRHTHTSPEKNLLKRTERREVHIDFHPGGGGGI